MTNSMYKAYSLESVLQNLPPTFSIECAATYRDTLLLGTKQGYLTTFRVTKAHPPNSESPLDVRLHKTFKSFSKKPINELVVVEDHDLLISLSDQTVNVHRISETFPLLRQFKGVTTFACGTQRVKRHNDGSDNVSPSDRNYTVVRLCIAQRRRIQYFYWKHNDSAFIEHPYEHTLPDVPRIMVWSSKEHLIVGFKTSYVLLKANKTGDLRELRTISRQPEPLITRLQDDSYAVLSEKNVHLVNMNGDRIQIEPIIMSELPVSLAYDYPYLMGLSPAGVEVHTINPTLTIQTIQITQTPKPLGLIVWKSGMVFVISTNNVWCLVRASVGDQLSACKDQKQFHLALMLAKLLDASDADKARCKYHLENLLAFDFFAKGQYQKAFKLFEEIRTDPVHVIGLVPSLLKEQYRKMLQYPASVPKLDESQLTTAMTELIVYLSSARRFIKSQECDNVQVGGILEGINAVRPKKLLLQIIDTTMLHLYINVNPNLVAALLSFKDNHCHLEESEALLKEHQKIVERIILYEQKGAHHKALQLLSEQALIPSSPLHGHEHTIAYLQRLSGDHFDLILEYAKWVIDAFPDDGLKIFTEGTCGRELLPRERVLQFLEKESPTLIVRYLEHLILHWHDDNVRFHNLLIHKYREQIIRITNSELNDPSVTSIREKLVDFLRTSNRYTPSIFPQWFLNDKLYLECAIVMGKLGRHQDALTIYIHVLRDLKRAEDYCVEQYLGKKACDRNVFIILLTLYITPAKICLKALDISAPAAESDPPDIMEILNLLDRHVDKLDPLRAIEMLPPEVPLQKLEEFITKLLKEQSIQLSKLRVLNALLLSDNVKAKLLKFNLVKFCVTIDDSKLCDICQRRINRSVFVHTEKGQIVHYACHNKTLSGSESVDN
ncbi:vam6/Vps39-like protein isoform X2 [Varroa destructor]|uniref:CNH domain-containing protein n=1 Tax=Varroa destructor TaxID=109461 RepID=A0A7M7J0H5_VARDE|nr:vam6/Vps39-like protein isoform X2 [Varroa destructor]